jgi:hypothetical protein
MTCNENADIIIASYFSSMAIFQIAKMIESYGPVLEDRADVVETSLGTAINLRQEQGVVLGRDRF